MNIEIPSYNISGTKNRPGFLQLDNIDSYHDTLSSSTDGSWSPGAMKMMIHRRKLTQAEQYEKKDFNLNNQITRKSFPLSDSCPLVLGSSSKNRKQILEMIAWPFTVMTPDIDEKAIRSTNYLELPQLIAKAKASALIERLKQSNHPGPLVLLTCDQVVVFQNQLREKPTDVMEATFFLSSYSNAYVSTISAVVATHYPSERQVCDIDVAQVYWNTISLDVVRKVVDRGEIFNSAGGFLIEDPDLNPLIRDIEGAMDSVVGMPISLTTHLLDIVRDQVSFELHEFSSRRPKIVEHDPEEVGSLYSPYSAPLSLRRRLTKAWTISRSRANSYVSESRSSSRTRSRLDSADLSICSDMPPVPLTVPSSPTDRALSPISMQIARRKSPGFKNASVPKKTDYSLDADMIRKPYPLPSSTGHTLIIGSNDLVKKKVLELQGWKYVFVNPNVPLTTGIIASGNPIEVSRNVSKAQADSVVKHLKEKQILSNTVIVTSHQVAMFQGDLRGIPNSSDQLRSFFASYSGNKAILVTTVFTTHYPSERQAFDTDIANVYFREFTAEQLDFLSTKPNLLKSVGGISMDDPELISTIHIIEGTVDSVAGIPIDTVTRLILNVADEYLPSAHSSPVKSLAKSIPNSPSRRSEIVSTAFKRYVIMCPGKKVPVRASPQITAPVIKYFSSGTKINTHAKTASGFYQLVDEPGYINMSTSGVQWIEENYAP